ncbi:MAG TPA: hypothetical protein VHE59_08715 [Mucilaginibacter sp.]|nr:hypothetical protein [Mucilaginibacter sp.]
MDKVDIKKAPAQEGEILLNDVLKNFLGILKYILSRWIILLAAGIIGGILLLAYSIFQKPTYTATCTFVLEENGKGGMLSQYAGLASLAGVNLDNTESGLFQGDNIFELYKSRLMIEKTLLSTADFDGKTQMLIERYIDFNNLRAKWKSKDDIDNITFSGNPQHFNRKQDSIITDLTKIFNKKYLSVNKPDKKLNIIEVDVKSKDELFAKNFTDKLVENVNLFYTQTKTKKSYQNLTVLQHQADSVRNVLNSQIGGVASAIDAAPNANPLFQSLKVPSQRKQVDVQASSGVYAEIVKNLEIAKISLRKDTPLIQLIDVPVLPLDNNRLKQPIAFVIGFLLLSFITCFWIGIRKLFSK